MGVTVVSDTLLATCTLYDVVTVLNVPILISSLRLRDFNVASEEGGAARVTVTVYVLVVVVSSAVTSTVMTLLPTLREITP